jgi:peptidoglycan/xylan/chitin deacetylase (PgdA/CDA1 family)
MTTRKVGIVTLWAVAIFSVAVAFSLTARAQSANPLLDADVADTFEVAIAPVQAPVLVDFDIVEEPQPTPIVDPTPVAPPVAPPAWIEIPEALIDEPEPVSGADVPLPMLTSIASAPRDGAAVYLTFDDGPNPVHTNQILDLLARYNAKATFFVLGDLVDAHPQIAQRIVAEGHTLGNHTYYHEALPRETDEVVNQTLSATTNAIARATGRTSSCMRPPYGSLDERTYALVQNQGFSVSMWEVDSNDWKTPDSYTIAASVLRDTNLGDRVLFHDGPANRASTVAAVESVLSVLSERGVRFAALPCS